MDRKNLKNLKSECLQSLFKIKDREDKIQELIQLDLLKARYQNELDKLSIAKERAKYDFSANDSDGAELYSFQLQPKNLKLV